MPVKVASAKASGQVRWTSAKKQSTDSRIKQLVRELNIDHATYKWQAGIRKYTRLANNQFLNL